MSVFLKDQGGFVQEDHKLLLRESLSNQTTQYKRGFKHQFRIKIKFPLHHFQFFGRPLNCDTSNELYIIHIANNDAIFNMKYEIK